MKDTRDYIWEPKNAGVGDEATLVHEPTGLSVRAVVGNWLHPPQSAIDELREKRLAKVEKEIDLIFGDS